MPIIRAIAVLVCSLAGPYGSAQTLNILTWEDYFSATAIAQWEAATGANIKQIYFDHDEMRNGILFSASATQIDIVALDPMTASLLGARGTFLPVAAYDNVPNLRHLNKQWAQRCAPYGSPYLWGTLGIAYRKDKIATPPSSWRDILYPRPELFKHIAWFENYGDTLAPSLILRGESASSKDETVLREVFEELKALLPALLTFDYVLSFVEHDPAADELYMALAYAGDTKTLNRLGGTDNWAYTIPQEGSMAWTDCLAIMEGSANTALALHFINFINTPEIAAENSETIGVATANDAARALQSAAFQNDRLLHPSSAQFETLQHYSDDFTIADVLLRNRITSTLVELYESQ